MAMCSFVFHMLIFYLNCITINNFTSFAARSEIRLRSDTIGSSGVPKLCTEGM
ncbi:hypothetical protein KC19_4G235700 [Ceratodon purpureus]|uniref:Uncharacterized protein n=1 Tax=Ceratodon purpureus TaxID=3225 RepID=A0A8T0IFG6_CERPU|nr:hypothetical protein KC19_4G235700 [Ceratodon purpureus]